MKKNEYGNISKNVLAVNRSIQKSDGLKSQKNIVKRSSVVANAETGFKTTSSSILEKKQTGQNTSSSSFGEMFVYLFLLGIVAIISNCVK